MLDLQNNDMCFGCGRKNECGLHLKPLYKEDHTEVEVIFKKIYQGWKNIVHGGIISTVMDETMFFELQRNGIFGVTYNLNVKFKKPVEVGKRYLCLSRLTKRKGKLLYLQSEITDEKKKLALAKAIFYEIGSANEKS